MTKKQKIKFIALLTTTASLAVGSYFFKKKVEKMKEDGTFNTMVFKKRLNQGLIVIRYYLALRGAENGVTAMVTPFFCVQG